MNVSSQTGAGMEDVWIQREVSVLLYNKTEQNIEYRNRIDQILEILYSAF